MNKKTNWELVRKALSYQSSGRRYVEIKQLLEAGLDIHDRDIMGDTIGMTIMRNAGSAELKRLLLRYGYDPETRDSSGKTELIFQIETDTWQSITVSILYFSVNTSTPDGNTALHHAVMRGEIKIVAIILLAGADAAKRNDNGETAADSARIQGKQEIADMIDAHASKKPHLVIWEVYNDFHFQRYLRRRQERAKGVCDG